MAKKYEPLIETRRRDVFGENDWYWIKADRGAWDGPIYDWKSHRDKFFRQLKHHDAIITAGANQGIYVRFYAKLFRAVYAFEPDPLNFHVMVNNCQYDNVVKINAALGEKPDLCRMQLGPGLLNTGVHRIDTQIKDTISIIPVMTIDSFNFPKVNVIQLDVEGYEWWALKGAANTIKRCHPIIILEAPTIDVRDLMVEFEYYEDDVSERDSIFLPLKAAK